MRSFEQVFRHQKSAKTPVNKGQNDFSTQKSPTSLGEEPIKITQHKVWTNALPIARTCVRGC
jgi:hypothetical protein